MSDGPAAKRPRVDQFGGSTPEEPLANLPTPCYTLELAVARANAKRMLDRADKLGVQLRPHVKTHKTLEGAEIQTGGKKRGIVVSTLAEAKFFADGGFDDILYAVPITADKLKDAAALTRSLEEFHIIVDHPRQVDALQQYPPDGKPWSVVLMVDCGYHRDGVDPSDAESVELARRISSGCGNKSTTFKGIYTHGGHSYDANDATSVTKIAEQERDAVVEFAAKLRAAGIRCDMVGVGSTPTCSNPPSTLEGVTEMHPGNYYYYDVMQASIGSCSMDDIAVRVCTRVLGHYPKQNMMIIDMGWTGISAQGKEHGYGAIYGHPELRIKTLKQEAGEVESADGKPIDFARYPIGTILRVLPWHSCASTHQHTSTIVLDNDTIVGRWKQVRGWGSGC
eukprot:gnl/TRDRNA2_/TRDRNA2_148437_c1_seq1.p1 gnl/TRDRNA2_/TRDRNA2_148437_c1~~gnl/TRDRNA2_/TRDRNA2_148437_c1_seq1.p1  ORF type:complete len:415 (-),score=71.63 gnl/TRDRNA2_/TRDRNA2_148437_c1_seq1:161-1342(-)